MSTSIAIAVVVLLTGFVAGVVFVGIGVPIPAPPTVTGILGITGIYLGLQRVEYFGLGHDPLSALGS
ncbi:MAG: XapX domain-containing protein [Halobacteriota archaeon]|uniref:XapX domain-containing protein n=1 Tax=Natronomonas sp. TaxID=2184060 RepID=UPI0039769C4E